MDTRDKIAAFAVGSVGGGIAAFIVWQAVKAQVDAQVQTSVRTAVDTEIEHKLADVGITPQVAAQLRTLIQNLDNVGVFSMLANATTVPSSGVRGRR